MSARLRDVELKMDQLLNNVNLLVSKLDKKETIYQNIHFNLNFVSVSMLLGALDTGRDTCSWKDREVGAFNVGNLFLAFSFSGKSRRTKFFQLKTF